jgi:hypothetical protein
MSDLPAVRDYPDIPARVVGAADPAAAQAIWDAVAEWMMKERSEPQIMQITQIAQMEAA